MSPDIELIIIEGGDGIGKESISRALRNELEAAKYYHIGKSYPDYNHVTGKWVRYFLNGAFGDPVKMDPKCACMPYIIDRHRSYKEDYTLLHSRDRGGPAFTNLFKGIRCVMDRGWTSNLLYQGAKVYFKDLFECISAGTVADRPFLGIFKDVETLDEELRSLQDTIKRVAADGQNTELVAQYQRERSVALVFDLDASAEDYHFPKILYGYVNMPADTWREYTDPSFAILRAEDLVDFSKWLYNFEIEISPMAEFPQQVYFITSDQPIQNIITRMKHQMISAQRKLDAYESAFTYQHIVQIFSEMVTRNKIVCDARDDKWVYYKDLFSPAVTFHRIETRLIDPDLARDSDDFAQQVKEANVETARKIVQHMEVYDEKRKSK